MQPLVRKTLSCWLFVGTIIIRPTLIEAGASFGSGLYVWPTHRGHIMPIPTPFRILRPSTPGSYGIRISSPLDRQLFTQAVAQQSFPYAGDPSSGKTASALERKGY